MFSLDAVRLIAAILVVWGHSYIFAGHDVPTVYGVAPHAIGVQTFFVLSGYLIAGSWTADRDIARYTGKRLLRIWPPLAAVVIVTVFIFGPIITILSAKAYFADSHTWQYLARNLAVLPKHDLPGVFLTNHYPVAVNGSLWTLPVELACYIAVPIMFLHRAGPWAFALLTVVASRAVPAGMEIAGFGMSGAASLFPWFAAGVLTFTLGARIPQGFRLPADLSYGLYLTSFPAGQTIVMLHPDIRPLALIGATLAVALPLAWLIHIVVEIPAARLKPRRYRANNPELAKSNVS